MKPSALRAAGGRLARRLASTACAATVRTSAGVATGGDGAVRGGGNGLAVTVAVGTAGGVGGAGVTRVATAVGRGAG
jgi:hypothetical protein